MCDKYRMDAYRARGMLPHCEVLCGEDCTNHPDAGTYCQHLYLLVQDHSDLVYKSLGIPTVDDPKAILGAQIDNIATRVNRVGADCITDSAFDVSLILSELSKKGALNISENLIQDIAYIVTLGLFLDNPEDTLDLKMFRVLAALKKIFPEQFAMRAAEKRQEAPQ
ncbi:MAG TPA: hypothetical protein VEG65_01140 [Candidatus Bathyarchaeia archaeon]|nr:hypothetical protein [Candidatus Bathyarchaeia archaeon]